MIVMVDRIHDEQHSIDWVIIRRIHFGSEDNAQYVDTGDFPSMRAIARRTRHGKII